MEAITIDTPKVFIGIEQHPDSAFFLEWMKRFAPWNVSIGQAVPSPTGLYQIEFENGETPVSFSLPMNRFPVLYLPGNKLMTVKSLWLFLGRYLMQPEITKKLKILQIQEAVHILKVWKATKDQESSIVSTPAKASVPAPEVPISAPSVPTKINAISLPADAIELDLNGKHSGINEDDLPDGYRLRKLNSETMLRKEMLKRSNSVNDVPKTQESQNEGSHSKFMGAPDLPSNGASVFGTKTKSEETPKPATFSKKGVSTKRSGKTKKTNVLKENSTPAPIQADEDPKNLPAEVLEERLKKLQERFKKRDENSS